MRKSKTKYLATIIFLLTVNIIWSVLYMVNRQNGASEIISKTNENNYLKGKNDNLNAAISLTFSADFRHQIESWIKQKGDIYKKEGLNLCCYYDSNVCNPCILSVMQDINSISIELGFFNLLVFTNVVKSNVIIRDLTWPTDVISVKDFPAAYKDGKFDLLLFLFEPGSGIREVYNPQALPDFQQEYFQNIRKEIKFTQHSLF